jgi:hypothetical protein
MAADDREAPRDVLLIGAALVAVLGVVVLAAWSAAWGLVLLFAAAGLYLLRGEVERRTGKSGLGALRAHAKTTGRTLGARSKGQMGVFRARRELAELEAERGRLLRELGEAVYAGEDERAVGARAAIDEITVRIATKQGEIEGLARETEEHVTRIRSRERTDEPEPPGG